ncbi:MAG: JAB domain-containing protein [Methylococcales bacterium]|nr:JAB domain-containing protein [Methylococcales bacterium]
MIISENTKEKISDAGGAATVCRALLNMEDEASREREHYWIIGLNAKNEALYVELCSLGTLTSAQIHPRETYRIAVLKGAASIIAVHNHPSGDVTPSGDDKAITERLQQAGDILGIKLLDHVIIANADKRLTGHYSIMRTEGK